MDNYVLVERLGQGSFAVVWKARRKSDHRLVAVKQLKQAPATWDDCKRLPEIRAAAAVRGCPHVIALLEAVRDGSELFLVFEYADSDLCRCLGPSRRFEEPHVRWAMKQLLSALAAVHAAGLVHCDVKPENLLLFARCGPGNTPVLKLCDLGQAAPAGEVKTYVGTRWYRAPELLLGIGRGGVEIDLWAAGCAMAELLLLRPPFPGNDTRDMLFRICSALGAPEDGYKLSEKLMEASGLRFAPCAAEGPIWFELSAAGASSPAVDLVRGLLRYDGARRIPASRALTEAFFSPAAGEVPIMPPETDRARAHSAERLKKSRDEAKAVERRLQAARGTGGHYGGAFGRGGLGFGSSLAGAFGDARIFDPPYGAGAAAEVPAPQVQRPGSPRERRTPQQIPSRAARSQTEQSHIASPSDLAPAMMRARGLQRPASSTSFVAGGSGAGGGVVGGRNWSRTEFAVVEGSGPFGFGVEPFNGVGHGPGSSLGSLSSSTSNGGFANFHGRGRLGTASCTSLRAVPAHTVVTEMEESDQGSDREGDDEELADLFWKQVEHSRTDGTSAHGSVGGSNAGGGVGYR